MIGLFLQAKENARLEIFTIHEPPNAAADRLDRAESLVFVRDGASWSAVLFGPLWLMGKGAWIGLVLYVAAAAVLFGMVHVSGAAPAWFAVAILGLNLLTALEHSTVQRWVLERRGWREIGTVIGRSQTECERRFFDNWLPTQPVISKNDPHSQGTLSAVAGSAERLVPLFGRGWRAVFGSEA